MEAEKTKLLISTQRQRVVEKDAETERKKAVIEAEKESQVAKIKYEQNLLEQESKQKMANIENEIHLAKERSKTDAEFYKIEREAEAYSKLLTPSYLELKKIEAIGQNNKVYYGSDIPNMFMSESSSTVERQFSLSPERSSAAASNSINKKPTTTSN